MTSMKAIRGCWRCVSLAIDAEGGRVEECLFVDVHAVMRVQSTA